MAKVGLSSSLFSIKELSEKMKDGDITLVDLVENYLNRIKTLNPVLNAFITVIEEQQLYKQAQDIKVLCNIFYVKGVRCTAGSKIKGNEIFCYFLGDISLSCTSSLDDNDDIALHSKVIIKKIFNVCQTDSYLLVENSSKGYSAIQITTIM
jgi:hypothetical protein